MEGAIAAGLHGLGRLSEGASSLAVELLPAVFSCALQVHLPAGVGSPSGSFPGAGELLLLAQPRAQAKGRSQTGPLPLGPDCTRPSVVVLPNFPFVLESLPFKRLPYHYLSGGGPLRGGGLKLAFVRRFPSPLFTPQPVCARTLD